MNDMQLILKELEKINSRLDKIDNRLDVVELKQDKLSSKLEDMQLDIKLSERNIRRDIHLLKDENETIIEILKMNNLATV